MKAYLRSSVSSSVHCSQMLSRSLTLSSLFPTADRARNRFAPETGAKVVRKLLSKMSTRQFGTTAAKSRGSVVKRQPESSSSVRFKKCSFGKASGIGLSEEEHRAWSAKDTRTRRLLRLQLRYKRRRSRRSLTGKSLETRGMSASLPA